MDTSLYKWSYCDVPFEGLLPKKCTPYRSVKKEEEEGEKDDFDLLR